MDLYLENFPGIYFDSFHDDTGGWMTALSQANGRTLRLPGGVNLNSIVSATLTLPRSIRIVGQTSRSVGNPPTAIGSAIQAVFGGPVFRYAPPDRTAADILLEGFHVRGGKETYGAGNGIELTNGYDCRINRLVVSNFGTNNIAITICNSSVIKDTYSAFAGNANIHIDSENIKVENCLTDAGQYGLQSTAISGNLTIDGGGLFEGSSVAGLSIGGARASVTNTMVNQTFGGKGLIAGPAAFRLHLGPGFRATGAQHPQSTVGIDLGTIIEYSLIGVSSNSFQTGAKFSEGFGDIIGGQLQGTEIGLDATGGGFWAQIIGTVIAGPVHSLLHRSGDRIQYLGCRFDDGTGAYKAPTILAGNPVMFGANASGLFARRALDASIDGLILGGGNGTGIVSASGPDTGGSGFRALRIPN